MLACFSCSGGQQQAERIRVRTAARPARPRPHQRGSERRPKKRGMLSRLIEGIVHLVEDDDGFTTASEGGSPRAGTAAPPPERQDSGHLTAGPSGTVSGPPSWRPSSGGGGAAQPPLRRPLSPPGGAVRHVLQAQPGGQRHQRHASDGGPSEGSYEEDARDSEGEEGESEGEGDEGGSRQRGWNILGGMPFLPKLVDLLSPKISESEEAGPSGAQAAAGDDDAHLQAPTSPGGSSLYPALAAGSGSLQPQADDVDLQGTTTEPAPLEPGQQPLPALSEPSGLMLEDHIRALAAAVPARYRQARWTLLYSTARDGISLQTMLRNAAKRAPTVLVVRDFDRHVFGAYCSEAWKLDKRFFGTGESFVFQLEPRRAVWYWWWRRMAKEANDYFQWAAPDAVAVGGAGGYALWLDADLSSGISRNCTTFGNDSLAGAEEFRVGTVEMWGLA